ncbi:MAG: hypothetical protein Q8P21_01080 [bacterium]|nr:hypothetical protein [bacterium]
MKFFQTTSLEKYQAPGLPQEMPRQAADTEYSVRDQEEVPPPAQSEPAQPTPPVQNRRAGRPNWLSSLASTGGWGLAVALVIVLLLTSLINRDEKATTTPSAPPVGAATPDELERGKIVRLENNEWSDFFNFPGGKTVDIRGMRADAQFAIQTQAGTYEFRPGQHPVVPGIIVRARVRALGPDPEEIWIQLR